MRPSWLRPYGLVPYSLAEEEPTLLLDLVRAQRGLKGDLGDQREKGLPVTRECLAAHFRRLDLTVRVQAAADVLRARRQLHRGAAGRAAEHGALEKIGDAGGRFRFEAGARAHLK